MKKTFYTSVLHYGIAVLAVVLALFATLLIWPLIKPLASPLFLAAIMISAWKGGRGAGLLATILSGLLLDYFFVPPVYSLGGSWEDVGRLVVLGLEGFVLSWLIASHKEAGDEAIHSREQLRSLSVHLQSVREDEMTQIAREIHDELGQVLTGFKYDVYWLDNKLSGTIDESSRHLLKDKAKALLQRIDAAISSVRRIMTELRPPLLDDLGLIAAIEWQTNNFQERTCIECKLNINLEENGLEGECVTAVFRIFQETLTNVARHANATVVSVLLKEEGDNLLLQIQDNGRGISEEEIARTKSFGILGMQERAHLLNGTIIITGQQGTGTTVTLKIPLHRFPNVSMNKEGVLLKETT